MESIADKLKLLNCPEDMYPIAYKHIVSLNLISIEELEKILRLLLTKKIIVPRNGKILVEPADFCVLASGYDVINERINDMENIAHELDAYRERLIRMNSKSAISNLLAMKGMSEPYKTPEGKYSKVPFSIRRFTGKYGGIEMAKKNLKEISGKEKKKAKVEPPKVEEPKIETINVEPPKIDEPKAESAKKVESASKNSKVNVFEQILQSPQVQALNDETFDRFERLTDSTRRILYSVYGVDELNDIITDNIIKLVTSDLLPTDQDNLDASIIFAAITFGKNISEEEKVQIKKYIDEEMQFANNMNVELGRAA